MAKVTPTSSRKTDHLRINLEEQVNSSLSTGLEKFHFSHEAVPEINLDDIDLTTQFINKPLKAPLLISSMTGGTEEAAFINRNLGQAAQQAGIAMGVGSQRAAIENPSLAASFQIRDVAPDILLFANLGAVQLNYGYGIDECQRAVDMISADALVLHFNALQEALQPEGDTHFADLLPRIEQVCKTLSVPVIAKEVGWGFSGTTAKKLVDVGIAVIDVAGAGGTSWSQVEMHRAESERQANLAASFIGWGIPTAESLQQVKQAVPGIPVIASGGLRNGIDIAKCIALGASLGGMANPYLKAAARSAQEVVLAIQEIETQLRVCMFAAGAADILSLQNTPLIHRP